MSKYANEEQIFRELDEELERTLANLDESYHLSFQLLEKLEQVAWTSDEKPNNGRVELAEIYRSNKQQMLKAHKLVEGLNKGQLLETGYVVDRKDLPEIQGKLQLVSDEFQAKLYKENVQVRTKILNKVDNKANSDEVEDVNKFNGINEVMEGEEDSHLGSDLRFLEVKLQLEQAMLDRVTELRKQKLRRRLVYETLMVEKKQLKQQQDKWQGLKSNLNKFSTNLKQVSRDIDKVREDL